MDKDCMRRIIEAGKEKGYVTYDELNELLDKEFIDSDSLEEIMDTLSDHGIQIVESEEEYLEKEDIEGEDLIVSTEHFTLSGRDGDPVKLYLREMGKIPLLKREEEIFYAKQIETGRKVMRRGLLRTSFLVDRILRDWGKLCDGKIRVQDIMDMIGENEEENDELVEKYERFIMDKGLELAKAYKELLSARSKYLKEKTPEAKKEYLVKHALMN